MTASNEWWATATKEQKTGYLKRCRAWLEKKHGEGCVVAEWLHVDERSPHLHAIVVPLYEGKLNAKHFLGGKARMRALQDDFAKVCGEPFGLSRGVAGSNADHVPVADCGRRSMRLRSSIEDGLCKSSGWDRGPRY